MTVAKGRGPFCQSRILILVVLFMEILLGVRTDARFVGAKNKKVHKFFDDSYDSFVDFLEEPSFHSSTSGTLAPKGWTATPEHQEVHSSVPTQESYEPKNASNHIQDTKKESKVADPCLGIRCRIGRVCQASDDFSGVWCVCADAEHCVDHGRRVCGSDGRFYFSHCEMHRMACVKNQRIRVSHDESSCVKSLQQTVAENKEQLHLALTVPTKSDAAMDTKEPTLPSTTTVDTEFAVFPSTSEPCTEVDYGKFVESLLQHHCIQNGHQNCGESRSRQQVAKDVMFSYYDNNSDQQLDIDELDAAERRDHLTKLSTICRLQDIVRFGDKNLDLTLTLAEFYAALGVPTVRLDEALRLFLTSATVGTSLELKCDVSGTTDYVWKRNGHSIADLTDNKIKVFNDGSLYISEVSLYHVGNYSCQDRLSDDVVQIHVVSVRVPPIVQVSPKTRFLPSGATVTIRCHVEGVPVPDVSWTANEMPLSDRPDHYALLHDGLTLQVRDADYSVDTGTFKCRANNYVGSAEDVATVFIENPDTLRTAYSDELYQLFVVFYDQGFGVYEPGHCHLHHIVKGDFIVSPRDVIGQPLNLCESNTTCVWGGAVNVKNRFIYVTQPELNRVVVVEVQDRFNPVEIIPTDESPVEITYVEHLDQVWVSCAVRSIGSDADSSKSVMVIQRASADVRHSIIHTQPIADKFDVVRSLFLPPANAFKQTSDYGYVVRGDHPALHKIDLNSMKYVKRLDVKNEGCIPKRLAFIPLAGKIFVDCDRKSSDAANVSSCFAIDYVTDKAVANSQVSCGDPYVSPDSRHLVIIKDDRKSVIVYRVEEDGSMELAFDELVDLHIGDLTFFATERGYDLFANSVDRASVLYMNLASGHVEIFKEGVDRWKTSSDPPSPNSGHFLPIVSGSVFSDYLLTPSTDALYVIDARRRHVQCEWQDVRHASVVAWVEVWNR